MAQQVRQGLLHPTVEECSGINATSDSHPDQAHRTLRTGRRCVGAHRSAILVSGGDAAYLADSFGPVELVFKAVIILLALRGLKSYL